MRESGVIISTNAGKAYVELDKNEKCSECKACIFTNNQKAYIEVVNTINAQNGDVVGVEIKSSKFLIYSFLVFLMPVLFMIAGYIIAFHFTDKENLSIIASFAGLAISFLLLKCIDSLLGSRNKAHFKIVPLVNPENFQK